MKVMPEMDFWLRLMVQFKMESTICEAFLLSLMLLLLCVVLSLFVVVAWVFSEVIDCSGHLSCASVPFCLVVAVVVVVDVIAVAAGVAACLFVFNLSFVSFFLLYICQQ